MSSHHHTKTRHYAALAGRLRTLRSNLDETEEQMKSMSELLLQMRSLAVANGAQFMAVSSLLDIEISDSQRQMEEHYRIKADQGQ